jgi:polar amino acid transport system substrate-binding protein
MRSMTAAVAALALAAGAATLSGQAPPATAPLRFFSTAWSPFTNEPGKPRFALDLVEAALGRVGVASTTTIVEPAEFTTTLLQGGYDGSPAAWKDPERERVLVFSQPYLENRLILVGRRGEDVSAAALGDVAGKRVALVEGYSYGNAIAASGVVPVPAKSDEDGLALVLARKADYVLMDELVVQFILQNYPNESKTKLNVGSTSLLTRPLYVAVRRSRPDAESIVERFNGQLRDMITDRTYHRLLHVSWILADVDGDGRSEFVPKSDLSGRTPPKQAYSLFSTEGLKAQSTTTKPGFYVGGTIYSDWAAVPNRYKVQNPNNIPDSDSRTASLFRFQW